MAATADGGGYWMVGLNGGVFSFGDARYFGSAGGSYIGTGFIGMVPTADGLGYWIPNDAGGLFVYGDAEFLGSCGSQAIECHAVGMATP
ncbi:MAG TPA: hypothetical protein VII96_06315 [Acidimicrobiales bacterium]